MRVEVLADADAVTLAGARWLAAEARSTVARRGRFTRAVSGGRTPWQMFRSLAREDVPWARVHLFQVDERVASAGDADRDLTHIRQSLLAGAAPAPVDLHPMPVDDPDLAAASARCARDLERVAGSPPVLDVVHLGLGADGHAPTAPPGEPRARSGMKPGRVVAVAKGHAGRG